MPSRGESGFSTMTGTNYPNICSSSTTAVDWTQSWNWGLTVETSAGYAITAFENRWMQIDPIDQEERRLADETAEQLLLSALTPTQRADYETRGYFDVVGHDSGDVYRVYKGRAGNVKLIRDGNPTRTFCAHPIEDVPNADTQLAQKLMLECAEREFLGIANVW